MLTSLEFSMLFRCALLGFALSLQSLVYAERTNEDRFSNPERAIIECYRTDTLEAFHVQSEDDVREFFQLINKLRSRGIQPAEETLAKISRVADSLRMYREQQILVHSILTNKVRYPNKKSIYDGDSICMVLINLIPKLSPNRRSKIYNVIANYKMTVKKNAEGIVNYQLAYQSASPEQFVDRFHVVGNLASAYLSIGDTIASVKLLGESLRLAPSLPKDGNFTFEYSNTIDYSVLSNLFRGLGDLDSAAYYIQLSEANHRRMVGHSRFDETWSVVLFERAKLNIALGNYTEAQLAIDTLLEIDPIYAGEVQSEMYESRGQYLLALESAVRFADENIESPERLLRLIELSLSAKQEKKALAFSRTLNELYARKLLETNRGLVKASEAQRESFLKQQKAIHNRHQQELAVLVERQRVWVSIAMMLLCVVGAFYAWRRYLRSRRRSENLSRMVNERDRDLHSINKELAERIIAMEQFNHLLSHDLREPIRSISGFTTLLKRKLSDVPKAEGELQHLEESVEQLKHLIAGIEALRKLQDIANDECAQTVDEICTEVAAMVIGKFPESFVKFHLDSDAANARVPGKLTSIALTELVLNAVLFSHDKSTEPEVFVKLSTEHCNFTVTDYGLGIDSKYFDTVFDSFKRLNKREDYPGAGIGLTLAKQAAEHTGGDLRLVHSKLGAGSTFQLEVSLVENLSDEKHCCKSEVATV